MSPYLYFANNTISVHNRLLLRRNNDSRQILFIALIGNILLVIYHRVFDNARAVLLGGGEEGVYGIAVEIYSGSSDDGGRRSEPALGRVR